MPYSSITEADLISMQPAANSAVPVFTAENHSAADSSMDSATAVAANKHLAIVGSTTVSSNASAKILKQNNHNHHHYSLCTSPSINDDHQTTNQSNSRNSRLNNSRSRVNVKPTKPFATSTSSRLANKNKRHETSA